MSDNETDPSQGFQPGDVVRRNRYSPVAAIVLKYEEPFYYVYVLKYGICSHWNLTNYELVDE